MQKKAATTMTMGRWMHTRVVPLLVLATGLFFVYWAMFVNPRLDALEDCGKGVETLGAVAATERFAMVTFLSFHGFEGCWNANLYIESAAKLGVSWRRLGGPLAAEFDMLALVADGACYTRLYSFQGLRDIGFRIVPVARPIYYAPKDHERGWSWVEGNRYEHTLLFTKLYLWALVQYELVLYFDADTLIVRPMPDTLMLAGAGPGRLGMEVCPDDTSSSPNASVSSAAAAGGACGAGVMVLRPGADEFVALCRARGVLAYDRELQEQAFLQAFYSPTNHNRSKFPLLYVRGPHEFHSHEDAVSVVHFVGNFKPWNAVACEQFKDMCGMWLDSCAEPACAFSRT